jgi:hypothetical protein
VEIPRKPGIEPGKVTIGQRCLRRWQSYSSWPGSSQELCSRIPGVRWIRRLVFGVVAILLALIVGFTQLGFSSGWVPISVLSFAMGAMNTALSRVGAQNVSLTFVTGTLSRIWSATRAGGQACASAG